MPDTREQWVPTRRSLISRLRNWEDHASWQEFFDTYWKLIYVVAVKSGLSNTEAEDVVQETVLSIAKKMPSYVYDPARCSFKGWLKHVTRLRIIDQLRKRRPGLCSLHADRPDTKRTSTVESIPDPGGLAIEEVWEQEWEDNLLDASMERVKSKAKAEQYQIFYMHMVQRIPAREVSRMLGVNLGKVYFACHRVGKMVKQERQRLEKAALVPPVINQ